MAIRHTNLGNYVGFTLAALSAALPARAQDAADPSAAETLQEVSITGSRLRGVAPVGSPVVTIDSEAIATSNLTTVDRLIAQTPQVFNLGVSEGSRGQNGGAGNIVYGNGVNLRGIGPYATLVLVDGHRAVSNGRSIDPSVLPSLALQRLEILTDGASAVYGSDAIAGVVNMIPIRNVDGGKILARYGFGADYSERQLGFAYGKTWNGGQAHIAFENGMRDNVLGLDRDFYVDNQVASGGRDFRLTQCDPGNIAIGTTNYAIPVGGVTAANRASLVAGTANRCEARRNQDLLPEQKYNSVAITFNQKFNDWLEFVADGFHTDREFYRHSATTVSTFAVPSSNAFFVSPPNTTPATENVQYLFTELPANDTNGHARNWEFTGGLQARLPGQWRAEGLVTYGENRDVSYSSRGLNGAALNTALASGVAATSFDPFGLKRTSAAVLAGISDQIFNAPTNSEFTGYELRFDGPVLSLPGGAVRVATGYERQEHDYHGGNQRGGPTAALVFRDFDRSVDSAYAELYIPVFGAANARTGLHKLEFNAAVRYDNYSDVGSTTNPKFGLNWSPLESLVLRSSYGTSLRAPIFAELYGNSSNLFVQNYSNPAAGGAALQGVALSGGNTALSPEKATTYTFGFDFAPEVLRGARLSASYFDIEYEGQITAYLSDLTILNREAQFAGTNIILRGAAAAARVAQLQAQGITLASGVLPSPVILFVDGRPNNLGISNTRGIDLQISYVMPTTGLGTFNGVLSGTYLTHYSVALTPTGDETNQLNNIFNPLRLKLRAQLGWNLAPFHAMATVSRVGGYDNRLVTPTETVASFTPVDLSLSVDIGDPGSDRFFGGGLTLGVDARNVFDTQPPYVNTAISANGSGGFDATAADPTGRVIGISVRKNW